METDKSLLILIILLLATCIAFGIVLLMTYIKSKDCIYEYIVDNKAYYSRNCFQKDQITYCESKGKIIEVDNYYEQ